MSLPPLLLERLKRRKIIQETPSPSQSLEQQDGNTLARPPESSDSREHEHNLGETDEIGEVADQEQEEIIAENYSDEEEENEEEDEVSGERDQEDCQDIYEDASHESTPKEDTDDPFRTSGHDDNPGCEQPHSHFNDESVIGCPNKYNIYHECGQYCIDNYSQPESLEPSLEQRKQLALVLRTYPMSNEWTVVYDPGIRTFYFWNIVSNLVSWLPPGMNGFISMSADQMRKVMRDVGNIQNTLE